MVPLPLSMPEIETVCPMFWFNCELELLSPCKVQFFPLLSVRLKFPEAPCKQPVTEVVWPDVGEACEPVLGVLCVVVVVLCCVVVVEGALWFALLSGVLLWLLTPVCPLGVLCEEGAVAELFGDVVVWFGVEEFCPGLGH